MAEEAPPEPARKDPIASISGQITVLSTGERALLRRLTQREQVDGVVIKLLLHAGVTPPQRSEGFAPWRLLAHVAALLAGTSGRSSHSTRNALGSALFAAGLSENRLLRLTAARGPALPDQIVRAARMLAQAGEAPVNLWTLLHLVGRDPVKAEEARIQIARDYYSAAARA